MGLPISKAIMKLHEGDLHITSQSGMGTTITMLIPAARTVAMQEGLAVAA